MVDHRVQVGPITTQPQYRKVLDYIDIAQKEEALFRKMIMPGIEPNGRINVKSLQDDMEFYKRHGFLESPVDLAKLIDTSFAEAAVQEMGQYAPKK